MFNVTDSTDEEYEIVLLALRDYIDSHRHTAESVRTAQRLEREMRKGGSRV